MNPKKPLTTPKLALSKETLRTLGRDALARAVGGETTNRPEPDDGTDSGFTPCKTFFTTLDTNVPSGSWCPLP